MIERSNIPESHKLENEKLNGWGYVELFEIKLRDDSFLYFKNFDTVTWQNKTWKGIPISFEGYASASSDSYSRPTLSIASFNGLYMKAAKSGLFIRASVSRYKVLYNDLLKNKNIYQKKTWLIWNITSLTRDTISFEVRNPMDGVNYDLPARTYCPPEFPAVTLR